MRNERKKFGCDCKAKDTLRRHCNLGDVPAEGSMDVPKEVIYQYFDLCRIYLSVEYLPKNTQRSSKSIDRWHHQSSLKANPSMFLPPHGLDWLSPFSNSKSSRLNTILKEESSVDACLTEQLFPFLREWYEGLVVTAWMWENLTFVVVVPPRIKHTQPGND